MSDETRLDHKELLPSAALMASSIPAGALNALVISDLYRWFAQPLGAPPIGWLHTWGLITLLGMVHMLVRRITPKRDAPDTPRLWAHRVAYTAYALMAWASGALIAAVMQ